MKRILIFLIIFCFTQIDIIARTNYSIGAKFGYFWNYDNTSLNELGNTANCCESYNSGVGNGLAFSGDFEYLLNDRLSFSAQFGLFQNSSVFKSQEAQLINLNGEAIQGIIEHKTEIENTSIIISGLANYRIYNNLYVSGGVVGNFPSRLKFNSLEQLISPEDQGVFLDTNSRIRNVISGDIKNASTNFAFTGGVSLNLPLNRKNNLFLRPSIFLEMGINDLVSSGKWLSNRLKANIAIMYYFEPLENRLGIFSDNIDIKKPDVTVTISAKPILRNNEQPRNTLIIKEIKTDMTIFLPNKIYYQQTKTDIPKEININNEFENFQPDLSNDSLDLIYSNLINIIGNRLEENKRSKIEISPYVPSNQDVSYGKKRADEIKETLLNNWEIGEEQIILQQTETTSNNLPYIEFKSNNANIFAPINIPSVRKKTNFDKIRFYMVVISNQRLNDWRIKLRSSENKQKEFIGKGKPENYFDWEPADNELINNEADSIEYSLVVKDNEGRFWQSEPAYLIINSTRASAIQSEYVFWIDHTNEIDNFEKEIEEIFQLIKDNNKIEIIAQYYSNKDKTIMEELLYQIAESLNNSNISTKLERQKPISIQPQNINLPRIIIRIK